MLETVKNELRKPCESFTDFYNSFICYVQDRNIDAEFKYFKNVNALNQSSMQSIIEHTYQELMRFDFNK